MIKLRRQVINSKHFFFIIFPDGNIRSKVVIQEFIQQHNLGIRDSEQEQFLKTLLEEIKALKRGIEITQVLPAEKKREIIGLKDQATQVTENDFSK